LPASLPAVRRFIDIWDCKGGNAPGRQTKPFAMSGRQAGGDSEVMDDTSVITCPEILKGCGSPTV